MLLGIEVCLNPADFVLDGDPAPPQKGGRDPQFSAHVYGGQTAAWIKMALGNNNNNNPICKAPECQKTSVADVGFGPDDTVL